MLCFAEEKIELEKTVIKDNKELPKILFVVPWQSKKKAGAGKQKLELHSLFGNLFMPVMPEPE